MHAISDGRLLGPMGEMSLIVRSGLEALFPLDAHVVLNKFLAQGGTLAVSVSVWDEESFKFCSIIDQRRHFRSREELISLLLCSCYIPLYYEDVPYYTPASDSCKDCSPRACLDGGVTNNMPCISPRTITVSPVIGEGVLSPQRLVFPASLSIMPGSRNDCEAMFHQGQLDAIAFFMGTEIGVS